MNTVNLNVGLACDFRETRKVTQTNVTIGTQHSTREEKKAASTTEKYVKTTRFESTCKLSRERIFIKETFTQWLFLIFGSPTKL